MENTPLPLVLVTGASGFIGAHVVRELLETGKYRVRGSVRDVNKEEKIAHLKDLGKKHLHPGDGSSLFELVSADLNQPSSWIDACKNCTYICHVASPFFIGCAPNEAEEKLYKPAREGTLSVFRAALQAKTVKRIVLTSSMAAVRGGHPFSARVENPEESWSIEEKCDPYSRSKTMAERAAWQFVEEHKKEEGAFELSTINPTLVCGPPLSSAWATSHEIPKRLLTHAMPAVPDFGMGTVDVRDVALAHRLAMETPAAAGHRFCCWAQETRLPRYAEILKTEFGPLGYSIPTGLLPKFVVWLGSWFDSGLATILGQVGKPPVVVDNSKIKDALGLKFRPEEDTLIDGAHAIIRFQIGGVPITDQYKEKYLK